VIPLKPKKYSDRDRARERKREIQRAHKLIIEDK